MTVVSHHEYAYGDERHAFANPARATRIVTDPLGIQRTFGVVYAGNASIANAAGEVTQFLEYSADGLATLIKRPNGQAIALAYGPRQRLASSTVADSSGMSETTRYTYDDAGQLTRVVAPDGAAMEYSYDAAHRLTGLHDGAGNTVHLTLDQMGNVTSQEVRGATGELVTRAQRTYDALNRLQKEQRDNADAGTSYEYDRGGNLTAATDPLARTTRQVFDNFDRVLAQSLPAAKPGSAPPVIGYSYSHQDQLLSVTDPRKLTTGYTVDGFGQQTSMSSPDTGTTTSQFDAAGNPDSSTDASARKTTYRFDAAHRVTRIGSSTFEYGKDGGGSTGRLIKMSDESGQGSYAYDGFGRMLAKIQTVGIDTAAKTFVLAYTYGNTGTSAGHVTSMTYPSGNRIDIGYGSDGRAINLAVTAPAQTRCRFLVTSVTCRSAECPAGLGATAAPPGPTSTSADSTWTAGSSAIRWAIPPITPRSAHLVTTLRDASR